MTPTDPIPSDEAARGRKLRRDIVVRYLKTNGVQPDRVVVAALQGFTDLSVEVLDGAIQDAIEDGLVERIEVFSDLGDAGCRLRHVDRERLRARAIVLLEGIKDRDDSAARERSTPALGSPTSATRAALLELFQGEDGEIGWYTDGMTASQVREALAAHEIPLAAGGVGDALENETGDDLLSALSWVRGVVAVLASFDGDGAAGADGWRIALHALQAAQDVRVALDGGPGVRTVESEAGVARRVLERSARGEPMGLSAEEVQIVASYLRNAGVRL